VAPAQEHGGTRLSIGQLLIRLGWFYLIAGVMDDFDPKAMFLRNTFAVSRLDGRGHARRRTGAGSCKRFKVSRLMVALTVL